jgi:hypothetical protein
MVWIIAHKHCITRKAVGVERDEVFKELRRKNRGEIEGERGKIRETR